jgi:hypothetical protein
VEAEARFERWFPKRSTIMARQKSRSTRIKKIDRIC